MLTIALLLVSPAHEDIQALSPRARRVADPVPYESVTESDRLYHEDRAQTIRGVVQEINTITLKDNARFSQMSLKTDSRVVPVHLGPSWFMVENRHLLELDVGREIEVVGSFETLAGRPVFVAAQIFNDRRDQAMRLRRADGLPVWVGGEYLP